MTLFVCKSRRLQIPLLRLKQKSAAPLREAALFNATGNA